MGPRRRAPWQQRRHQRRGLDVGRQLHREPTIPAFEGAPPAGPREREYWHVEGDFCVHYLDSPGQALLVVPHFSDVSSSSGATWIAPVGVAHPEGAIPEDRTLRQSRLPGTYTDWAGHPELLSFPAEAQQRTTFVELAGATGDVTTPRTEGHLSGTHTDWAGHAGLLSFPAEAQQRTTFVELTGATGDVVLSHPLMPPLMMHSKSPNVRRAPCVVSNPPVSLRAPLNFDRDDSVQYCLVERTTLWALGVKRIAFSPTTERKLVAPKRVAIQRKIMEEEQKQLGEMRRKASGVESDGHGPIAVA